MSEIILDWCFHVGMFFVLLGFGLLPFIAMDADQNGRKTKASVLLKLWGVAAVGILMLGLCIPGGSPYHRETAEVVPLCVKVTDGVPKVMVAWEERVVPVYFLRNSAHDIDVRNPCPIKVTRVFEAETPGNSFRKHGLFERFVVEE